MRREFKSSASGKLGSWWTLCCFRARGSFLSLVVSFVPFSKAALRLDTFGAGDSVRLASFVRWLPASCGAFESLFGLRLRFLRRSRLGPALEVDAAFDEEKSIACPGSNAGADGFGWNFGVRAPLAVPSPAGVLAPVRRREPSPPRRLRPCLLPEDWLGPAGGLPLIDKFSTGPERELTSAVEVEVEGVVAPPPPSRLSLRLPFLRRRSP